MEIQTDAACHVLFWEDGAVKRSETSPATTADKRMAAEATQFFSVHPGSLVMVIGA